MYGPPEHMMLRFADGSSVLLGGQWRYQFVPTAWDIRRARRGNPWAASTSMYNAMIAPFEPMVCAACSGIRANPTSASRAISALCWRRSWATGARNFGSHLPFLIVELPNFGTPADRARGVRLGEFARGAAPRRANDPQAALAVTIDVGERQELHPPDKQVGGRTSGAGGAAFGLR